MAKKKESIIDKFMGMSQMQQILSVGAVFLVLALVSVGGVALASHLNSKSSNETTEENVAKTGVVDIPSYSACTVSCSSLQDDLTICVKDSFDEKVSGQKFQVKLLSTEDATSLNEYVNTINTLNAQIAPLAESGEGSDFSGYELDPDGNIIVPEETDTPLADSVTTVTGTTSAATSTGVDTSSTDGLTSSKTGEALTEYESLLYQKSEAIEEYSKKLSMLQGQTFTDDDGDGLIHITGLTAGNYVACIFPTGGYDPASYMMNVTVKDTLEYVVDDSVMDKVVSEGLAGDEEDARDIDDGTTPADSVSYVESQTKTSDAKYTAVKSQTLTASVSSSMKTVEKEYTIATTAATSEETSSSTEATSEETSSSAEATSAESSSSTETTAAAGASNKSDNIIVAKRSMSEMFSDWVKGFSFTQNVNAASNTTAAANKKTASLSVTNGGTIYSDISGQNSCILTIKAENIKDIKVTQTGDAADVTATTTAMTVKAKSTTTDATITLKVSGTVSITGVTEETFTVEVAVLVKGTGNQLYASDGSTTIYVDQKGKTQATYANYVAGQDYYQKTGESTSSTYGWQKSGTKTMYYDKNGKAVTGAQIINGVKYTFDTKGNLITKAIVDVNKYSGNVDWNKASTVVDKAIIRAGFRGTNGTLAEDSSVATYIAGASEAGIKVGLYVTSRATTEAEAVEEASLAIKVAEEYGNVTLPIYMELGASEQQSLSKSDLSNIVSAFCKVVKSAGYTPGVYGSKTLLSSNVSSSSYNGADVWVGQIGSTCNYKGSYDMVNYNTKGTVLGFSEKVSVSQER